MGNRALSALISLLLLTAALRADPAASFLDPGSEKTALVSVTDSSLEGVVTGMEEDQPVTRGGIRGDYLLWWTKKNPVPGPLVTSGSPADVRPGALGMPGTVVLLGDADLDYKGHSGLRLSTAFWLDPEQTFGIEAGAFVLETHTIHFQANSDRDGSQVIARPYFNAQSGREDAQVISSPGELLGGIDLFSDSRLLGAEASGVVNLFRQLHCRADVLAGLRFLGLREDIRVSQSSTLYGAAVVGFFGDQVTAPNILSLTDRLKAHNEFYGGQLGARGEFAINRLVGSLSGKLGLGSTYQVVDLQGITQQTSADAVTVTGPGGLLALASNSGFRSRHRFSAVAEIDARLGYQLTRCLTCSGGYTFLFWDDVARPGDQIDLRLNPGQVPSSSQFGTGSGSLLPARSFGSSDFWAQGLNLALEFRY